MRWHSKAIPRMNCRIIVVLWQPMTLEDAPYKKYSSVLRTSDGGVVDLDGGVPLFFVCMRAVINTGGGKFQDFSGPQHDAAFTVLQRHSEHIFNRKTVLLNLLLCLIIFYSLFYMIGSVCFGAFRLNHFDGLILFHFETEPAESKSEYLVNLISLELTYFCSGILFAAVVKRQVWDYALTVTLLHVIITSLVMLEFPMVWQWWLALGSGLFLMICNGQLIAYFMCPSEQS